MGKEGGYQSKAYEKPLSERKKLEAYKKVSMRLGGTAAVRGDRGHTKATRIALMSKERGRIRGDRGDRVKGWQFWGELRENSR